MTWDVLGRYAKEANLPPPVQRAVAASMQAGIDQACLPEVGRLLQALAAIPDHGRIAELGTAAGIGTAWLASGMRPGNTLLTFEHDPDRAAVARGHLAGIPGVQQVVGESAEAAGRGPFDLVFADGGPKHEPDAPDRIAAMLRLGGIVLFDDFTPGRPTAEDSTRALWFGTPRFHTVELTLTAETAVLLGVRRA